MSEPPKVVPKPPPLVPYSGLPSFSSFPKKLPSRNWLIFIGCVTVPVALWKYDRDAAKALKEEYLEKVRAMGQEPLKDSIAGVRTVSVYAGRFPGEEDGKAAAWWKRYMKPYFVASAVDYKLEKLPQYGSLARVTANKIQSTFRSTTPDPPKLMPTVVSPREAAEQEIRDGVVLIGRQTLIEYVEGLRRGWLAEEVASEDWVAGLKDDGVFSLPPPKDVEGFVSVPAEEPNPTPTVPAGPPVNLFPLYQKSPNVPSATLPPPTQAAVTPVRKTLLPPSTTPPPTPPLLLVPYHPNIGFTSIPRSIYQWFRTVEDVKLGGEAAMAILLANKTHEVNQFREEIIEKFDKVSEGSIKMKDWEKYPESREDDLKEYYVHMKERLERARSIAGGRALTDAEMSNVPKTEPQLIEEREMRERRKYHDIDGWGILSGKKYVFRADREKSRIENEVEGKEEELKTTMATENRWGFADGWKWRVYEWTIPGSETSQ